MTDQEAMQLFSVVGEGAKDALESWVLLQWVDFWMATGFSAAVLIIAGFIVWHTIIRKTK